MVYRHWFTALEFREMGHKATAVPVLCLLASYADRNGVCFPSQQRLADELGFTRRAVSGAIGELERLGYLTRETRGRQRVYRLQDPPSTRPI